jgi:hypothetical protein
MILKSAGGLLVLARQEGWLSPDRLAALCHTTLSAGELADARTTFDGPVDMALTHLTAVASLLDALLQLAPCEKAALLTKPGREGPSSVVFQWFERAVNQGRFQPDDINAEMFSALHSPGLSRPM